MIKPFSQACANNGPFILSELNHLLKPNDKVLEIGSGTGQHAVLFAQSLPDVRWQTSDLEENHPGISLWLNEAQLDNLSMPLTIDVNQHDVELGDYEAIFMANTLHIMSMLEVENCFQGIVKTAIKENGLLIVYGPFNYEGQYTSESNARFDQWLKAADVERGIRDFEWVNKLAEAANLVFEKDIEMPANNRLIVWRKETL
jgi:cyclopropane fatty-acyl-phospholipid synthase-like methyltransferase